MHPNVVDLRKNLFTTKRGCTPGFFWESGRGLPPQAFKGKLQANVTGSFSLLTLTLQRVLPAGGILLINVFIFGINIIWASVSPLTNM